ncbi:MAG TPA: hypothetical protein VGR47_16225 [Terracidiphilus sp.]|nr:hypothetical protein [Terracidiphilus sp.]
MRTILHALFFAAICLCYLHSQSPPISREQLQQYVAQLQANPTDDALRTKIIQLALTLDPKPAATQDAAVDAAKGKTIFASAGSTDDMKAAAAAFAQASLLAPWMPDYYYNEGLAFEKAKQFDDAIHALNFYLLAAPNAADAADVRGKIEGIKYEKESSARQEQAEEAINARQKEAELRDAINGTWSLEEPSAWVYRFHLSGDNLSITYGMGPSARDGGPIIDGLESGSGTLAGHSFAGRFTDHPGAGRTSCIIGQFHGSISTDNTRIYLSLSYYVNPNLTPQDRSVFQRHNLLNCTDENITLEKVANQ